MTAITLTIGGRSVVHPGTVFDHGVEQLTPLEFWGRANSYSCPRGAQPGTAWLMLLRSDLDELDKDTFHTLRWQDGTRLLSIPSLSIVSSWVVNRAVAGDKKAVHVVELQDRRRQLAMSVLNDQYNVRIPAPSTTSGAAIYYAESLNVSVAWTWQTMLDDIWGNLPTIAGTAPTLPYSPDGTPEGWRFIGENAWAALHSVLHKIGCTTAFNPLTGVFSYVRLGTVQAGLASAQTALTNRLMYDYDAGQDYHLGNMPETIRVFFHRRELYHGIEEDTIDSGNWEMSPVVSKDHSTGITGAQAGSVLVVWDDLPATFNAAGTNTNSAALQTRADEIGANIEARIDLADERLRKQYSGLATTILPGAQINEVRWRDFGDDIGLVTEIKQGPSAGFAGAMPVAEHLLSPDLDRATHPLYPRLPQPVQVDDGASSSGVELTANGDGLFPGFVLRWAAGGWSTLEDCWIRPTDLSITGVEATVVMLRQKDRFVGRLSGIETSGGSTRPVYLVRSGLGAEADVHDVSADNGATVTLNANDTLDFDASDQSFATEANSTDSLRGIVNIVETDGGDATIKRVSHAIDKSPLQNVVLSGTATSGTTPVLVRDGTRNSLELIASDTDSPIDIAGGTGTLTFTSNDPLHTVDGDTGSQSLDFRDTLELTVSGDGSFAVTKALDIVTATLTINDQLPIGTVIMSAYEPILSGGKYYIDDGTGTTTADTDWALMDGTSNASPGSGIEMWERGGSPDDTYFVRAKDSLGTEGQFIANTAFGRTSPVAGDSDIASIDDHEDHVHDVLPDACHVDPGAGTDHFDFTASTQNWTSIQKKASATIGDALTLVHVIDNGQGGADNEVDLMPAHKKLHFFEKVA